MKKFFLFKTFVFILAGFFFSCSDGTVPSPEMQKITESESGNTAVLSAPKNLTASQGGKREINLTWDSVSKASLYYIYAADSLFSEYKLVGETLKNSFSYSPLGAGITKYIRVCSADYAGNFSSKTEPVSGTTLAQPVISDITEVTGEEDSSLVVWWYMENADFYKDELEYTIICKNSEGKEVANSNVYASELENTSFKLTDLKPSETYVYTVTAFLSTNPSATETSLEVNAETARRLRPNPPEELTATQGTSTSQITLSFKLPQKVDVLVAAKTYEEKPLYFKIYRRINGSENWTTLVSHLYYDGSETEPASFDSYTAGTEISWTDTTNLQRGVQYEYKVQSYADNISRVITSDLSSVTASGFLAAVPTFRADVNLITDADEEAGTKATKYVSASVSFEGNWETFGTEENWKFVLTTTYSGTLDGLSSASGSSETFDSLSELNAYSKSITLSDGTDGNEATEGYYKFALTIVSAEDSSNELLTTEAADTFFLTSLLTQPNFQLRTDILQKIFFRGLLMTAAPTPLNEKLWTPTEAQQKQPRVRSLLQERQAKHSVTQILPKAEKSILTRFMRQKKEGYSRQKQSLPELWEDRSLFLMRTRFHTTQSRFSGRKFRKRRATKFHFLTERRSSAKQKFLILKKSLKSLQPVRSLTEFQILPAITMRQFPEKLCHLKLRLKIRSILQELPERHRYARWDLPAQDLMQAKQQILEKLQ